MIIDIEITELPVSGMYPEKIYDAPSSTQEWTWVRFETDLYETFYGQFRGKPVNVAISPNNSYCYVLTESFLYEIDRENVAEFSFRDYEDAGRSIRNITFTPKGALLLSDYYTIFTVDAPLCRLSRNLTEALIEIENPFHLDYIEFKNWDNNHLQIRAQVFLTGQPIELIYDSTTNKFFDINNKSR